MGMAAILVMWPLTFGSNLSSIDQVVSEKTEFWYIDGTLSDLGWKVNPDLWNCLLTYQVRTMTKASTVLKKTFSKRSHLNALGSKFDLDVKQVKVNPGSSFEQSW